LGVYTDIDDRKRLKQLHFGRTQTAWHTNDTLAQTFTGILAQVGAAKQVLMDDRGNWGTPGSDQRIGTNWTD